MATIRFSLLSDTAVLPTRKFPTDAGWDLYADEDKVIEGYTQQVIKTGIRLADVISDQNVVLQIWSRSGMDAKYGLHVGAGIVDSEYRGEILVLLKNTTDTTRYIVSGDKIAQLVILYLPEVHVEEVETIHETYRGEQGGITEHVKSGG
jgi:dUTP pyrophosphatase